MFSASVRKSTAATLKVALSPAVLKEAKVDLDDALWLHRQPREKRLDALTSFRGSIILQRVHTHFMSSSSVQIASA